MALYETSTHRANWIFDTKSLRTFFIFVFRYNVSTSSRTLKNRSHSTEQMRSSVNQRVHNKLSKTLIKSPPPIGGKGVGTPIRVMTPGTQVERKFSAKLNMNTPPAQQNQSTPGSKKRSRDEARAKPKRLNPCLRLDEELYMIRKHLLMIPALCKVNNLSDRVCLTASMFFKRFYLSCSIMEEDPKIMLPTAVFLACKVEEEDGGGKSNGMAWKIADSIEDGTINRKVLLDNEMRLLLGLKCDLVVHHPSKHVFNFVRMIGKKLREKKVVGFHPKQEKNLFESCNRLVTNLYATDAVLLYEPPELAIAVLRICARETQHSKEINRVVDEYIKQYVNTNTKDIEAFADKILEFCKIQNEEKNVKMIKRIRKLLKRCRNNLSQPSPEERERQKLLEDEEDEMKERAQKRQKRMNDESMLLGGGDI